MSALREPLIQIDLWIIGVVKEDQPFISVVAEPFEGIFSSIPGT
jgi:hypothetical protein